MSAQPTKDNNLVQLKTDAAKKDQLNVKNQINALEKSLNDVHDDLAKSTRDLNSEISKIDHNDKVIETTVNETLNKITEVESEIKQLYKDIDSTNASITKNVSKLETEQSDLSGKVSETYKQLGDIEKSYSALKTKSSKITTSIKGITVNVENLSDEIRQKILLLEDASKSTNQHIDSVESLSNKKSAQLSFAQEELIERTNNLAKQAKKTSSALYKSIKENSALMTSIEAKLIAEIESLAKSTDDKTASLKSEMNKADDKIKSHSAKMLLLQSVDEALDKRVIKLDETAKQLTYETQILFKATATLELRSTALEDSVETLDIELYRIKQENEIQQAQIDVLREKTTNTNIALLALSKLETLHFKVAASLITLVIVSVIALYFFQDYKWAADATATTQQTAQVNQQINSLSQHVKTEDGLASDRIAQLESQIVTLNQQLQTVNDKNVSLDNRLVNIAPHRQIGIDNVLHSQQWISQQSGSHFTIKTVTADSEAEIFELAVRYNHYLTDILAFRTVNIAGKDVYELYMGNYSDEVSAEAVLKSLPFRLNGEAPVLTNYSYIK